MVGVLILVNMTLNVQFDSDLHVKCWSWPFNVNDTSIETTTSKCQSSRNYMLQVRLVSAHASHTSRFYRCE